MRTTGRLDREVAAAQRLGQERDIGLGEAVKERPRAGLAPEPGQSPIHQPTASVGLRVDVTDVADALELLDQFDAEEER